MHAQEALSRELLRARLHLAAMRAAARRFLPDCKSLRAEMEGGPRLLIEKQGHTLDVRQLSDGERSMLALVLYLARRLSQASPGLDDPVRGGAGVVMLDEIDFTCIHNGSGVLSIIWKRHFPIASSSPLPNRRR